MGNRIFDMIAEICAFVIRSCPDESVYVKYGCMAAGTKKRIYKNIRRRLPVLFEQDVDADGNPAVHQLEEAELTDGFHEGLTGCFSEYRASGDLFSLIGLLQVLDESLRELLLVKIRELQEDRFSPVLNFNRETTGIGLLPRCSCVWERSNRLSQSYNRLDNYLFHFLLIENDVVGDLFDQHIFLPTEMFPEFWKKRCLTAAMSPLSLRRPFRAVYYEENDVRYCTVSYDDRDFSAENQLIWRKLCQASEKRADIAVFPELLGNPRTPDEISRRLRALSPPQQKKMPSLIVLPSFYEKKCNTAVMLGQDGRVISRQCKQKPYREIHDRLTWLEDIRTNHAVSILHYEGIGRIAVMICKDFLNTSYMELLMRCFKLTLIIVPSFSTGSYDFRQSFDLCAHDDCSVIWINSCAAMIKGKEANFENIGYIRKRIGRDDDDSQKLCKMPACQGAFEGQCAENCLFFETIREV